MSTIELKPGLTGVYLDESTISQVNPDSNSLTYRGYAVEDLCANTDFESTAYLLWNKELPSAQEKADFIAAERQERNISPWLLNQLKNFPHAQAHPMDTVRTAVSLMALEDTRTQTIDAKNTQQIAFSLYAKLPTLVAALMRLRKGLEPIAPRMDLTFSENFFYMAQGEVPDQAIVKCFDISMILYAEHGFNASTFTSRVILSSESDLYSAIVGAIGSLKGPLHGGANEAVMHTFNEIGSASNALAWLEQALANKYKIMGFGHRVYKNGDSRVPTMKSAFVKMANIKGAQDLVMLYETLEQGMIERKKIYPNLDFPAGPAYHLMSFDIDFFTPFFVMSRITGWTAHCFEQQTRNKLIRPLSLYSGVAQRSVM
jgi:citrate synthase